MERLNNIHQLIRCCNGQCLRTNRGPEVVSYLQKPSTEWHRRRNLQPASNRLIWEDEAPFGSTGFRPVVCQWTRDTPAAHSRSRSTLPALWPAAKASCHSFVQLYSWMQGSRQHTCSTAGLCLRGMADEPFCFAGLSDQVVPVRKYFRYRKTR